MLRNIWMLSMVCCSSPCIRSMTKMAMSHKEEPRLRRLVKDSWPGVSMTNKPGRRMSNGCDFCMTCNAPANNETDKKTWFVRTEMASNRASDEERDLRLQHEGLAGELRGADLLRDAASFALLHVGVTDLIQQLRLAYIVNQPHGCEEKSANEESRGEMGDTILEKEYIIPHLCRRAP